MLELAINYIPQLQNEFKKTLFKERYKYYFRTPIIDYYIPISDSSDEIQYVSLNENKEVIGYFSARLNLINKTGYDLEAINFQNEKTPIFTQDLFNFNCCLFNNYGMNRLVWSVIVGNPAERLYDRLSNNFGARIVGIFKNDVMLYDGNLYDLKYYELFKNDFINRIIETNVTANTYRDLQGGAQ